MPLKVVIKKKSLGGYKTTTDTIRITDRTLNYETLLPEPEFLEIVFFWPDRKLTSTSFWVLPSLYQLVIGDNLEPTLVTSHTLGFASSISKLEKEVKNHLYRSDSLVKHVNFDGKKLEDVERRIYFIRDSINNLIDNKIYKRVVLAYSNSPLGLYALCKYAERPFVNQRTKSQPAEIAKLLNRLSPRLKELHSGQILLSKLTLGQQMAVGKVFEDISLLDTVGKVFKVSDFKGKYLLVDFWASWCVPCREENPWLIKAYNKYKNAGFQIIGITIDKKSFKNDWLKAIAKDEINIWPQLSDFDNLAQSAYGIRFIPANYLLDPNGVIIVRDLRGTELEEKLIKILK
ncbi:thiol-disulfide isomerase/thioredoxin [Pedobacter sp. CG_S7]|uniref:peroxiredoxin family protein n=1 Tax=Pedobacter sp. CG_S7 TaxID=3143930 RepID=UPI003398AC98